MSKKEKNPPLSTDCLDPIRAIVQRHEPNKQFIRILVPDGDGVRVAHIRVPLSRSRFYKPHTAIQVRHVDGNFYEPVI